MESNVVKIYQRRELKRFALKLAVISIVLTAAALIYRGPLYNPLQYRAIMTVIILSGLVALVILIFRFSKIAMCVRKVKRNILKEMSAKDILTLDNNYAATGCRAGNMAAAGKYLVSTEKNNFFIIPIKDIERLYLGRKRAYLGILPMNMEHCLFLVETGGKGYAVPVKDRDLGLAERLVSEAFMVNPDINASQKAEELLEDEKS